MTVSEFVNKVGFKVKNEDVNKVNSTISDIKNTATRVLGAIGVGLSLTAINGLVEEFSLVNQQVKNSTASLGDQAEIQQKILRAAKDTRSSYEQTASVVSDLVKENSELFGTIDKAIAFNNAATMLFKTAGKTNAEIAGLMEAINKSFAKGYVDSETLSQLLERAPEAVELLCKELGTTQSQLEKLASDGKFTVENLYNAFISNSGQISDAFGDVKMTVTEAITVIRNQWGHWLAETNEMLGLTDTIGKTVVKVSEVAMRALTRVRTGVIWLTEKLGGTENLLKTIAIVAGSIYLAMNFSKIITGLSSIAKMLAAVNFKMLAIIAVIVLIALLVEDFINFIQGNNSLLGEMLKRAGIDADALREKIIGTWQKIRDFLVQCWEFLKQIGGAIWGAIQAFFAEHGETIKAELLSVWEIIKNTLITIWNIIATVAQSVFNTLKEFWAENGDSIKSSLSAIWNSILSIVSSIWGLLKKRAEQIFEGLKAFWEKWGGTITALFAGSWKVISTIFAEALKFIEAALAVWAAVLSGDWQAMWDAIKNYFVTVWDGIKTVLTTILDTIKTVLASAWTVIEEKVISVWERIKNAIVTPIQNAWSVVSGVIEKLKHAFDFEWSLPELKVPHITVSGGEPPFGIGGKGSLPSFDIKWYKKGGILDGATIFGAMGGKLLGGGEAGKEAVLPLSELWKNMKSIVNTGINNLLSFVRPMAGMNTVSTSTVSNVTNSADNRSIVQNVNYHNEFHGERAVQQKAASTMKTVAKDTTAELARGLAFGK